MSLPELRPPKEYILFPTGSHDAEWNHRATGALPRWVHMLVDGLKLYTEVMALPDLRPPMMIIILLWVSQTATWPLLAWAAGREARRCQLLVAGRKANRSSVELEKLPSGVPPATSI